jgi:hypothetical protein
VDPFHLNGFGCRLKIRPRAGGVGWLLHRTYRRARHREIIAVRIAAGSIMDDDDVRARRLDARNIIENVVILDAAVRTTAGQPLPIVSVDVVVHHEAIVKKTNAISVTAATYRAAHDHATHQGRNSAKVVGIDNAVTNLPLVSNNYTLVVEIRGAFADVETVAQNNSVFEVGSSLTTA